MKKIVKQKSFFVFVFLLPLILLAMSSYSNNNINIADNLVVKVFFNNNRLDPQITCIKVFPVERPIKKTKAVARADFDQTLEYRVAGSCRVQAIRAQIEHTLRQFPTVTEVVISINGKTEEILEP